jgi:hypothetical protein
MAFHLLGPVSLGILSDIASERVAARTGAFGHLLSGEVPVRHRRTSDWKGARHGTESIKSHGGRREALNVRRN